MKNEVPEHIWRAEYEHFKHLEPNYHEWKRWMIAERDGTHKDADNMGSGIVKAVLRDCLIYATMMASIIAFAYIFFLR
jgi:hypothetical protein